MKFNRIKAHIAQSDARKTVEAFCELSKEDRDAIITFLDAI